MRNGTRFMWLTVLATVVLVSFRTGAEQTAPATPAQPRPPVFVAIYERGPAWDAAKGTLQQAGIAEHMQFLRTNLEKLVAAAPFQQGLTAGSSDRTVGMVLVLAPTQDDAEKLVTADPAITGKLMTVTVRRWLVDRVRAY
jgi:hypothetical protein